MNPPIGPHAGREHVPCVVGRYTIHHEIAAGGLGTVYFARLVGPVGFSRTVVAKRPHPHLTRDPEFALMVIDEGRLAARIRHPNVVSMLDVIQTESDLVLIMEYVHGESLSKLHRAARAAGERVPASIAASVIIDVLHGLHAAHEATDEHGHPLHMVHRDVSPQNILVGADGISRLIDFGIAKASRRAQNATGASIVKGKYAYMAPEQVEGGEITRLADTFAAAIVLWELLTGEPLFQAKTDAETMHRCLTRPIVPPSARAAGLPAGLDDIVMRGLERDPRRRYPTARAMAVDLEGCMPPIRGSEIGAWVELLARDALAERSRIIAEIEQGVYATAAAPTTVASSTLTDAQPTVYVSAAVPAEERGRAERTHATVRSTNSGRVRTTTTKRSWAQSLRTRPGGSLQRWWLSVDGQRRATLGVVAGALLLPVIARGIMSAFQAPPHGAATNQVQAASSVEEGRRATAPSASSSVLPSPSPLAVVPAPTSSATVAAPAPSAPPSVTPPVARPVRRPPPAPRAAPPTPTPTAACNPPYEVDLLGRQIFKPECL